MKKTSLAVRRSRSGLGLFALRPFKRGEFIIEYKGEHISHDEADKRGGKYLFTLNKKVVIDGKSRKNIARYINHGCKPNAEAESDDSDMKVRILARRAVKPGDEITYDYGKEYWDDIIKPYGCKCETCSQKP